MDNMLDLEKMAKSCGSVEELMIQCKEKGLDYTEEQIKGFYTMHHLDIVELTDEELDNVSGGENTYSCFAISGPNVYHRYMELFNGLPACELYSSSSPANPSNTCDDCMHKFSIDSGIYFCGKKYLD